MASLTAGLGEAIGQALSQMVCLPIGLMMGRAKLMLCCEAEPAYCPKE